MLFNCKENLKDKREEKPLIVKEKDEKRISVDSISSNKVYDEIPEFIHSFYDSYLKEVDNFPVNFEKVDSLKSKFCSKQLLAKLDSLDLTYDPFLNAQDVTTNLMKSLVIEKEEDNLCVVTYIDDYTKKKVSVRLKVNKLEEGFEISDIIN